MRNSFAHALPRTAPVTGIAPRPQAVVFATGIGMESDQAP